MSVNSAWKIVGTFGILSGSRWNPFSAGKLLVPFETVILLRPIERYVGLTFRQTRQPQYPDASCVVDLILPSQLRTTEDRNPRQYIA
jgi:hypothetical protein